PRDPLLPLATKTPTPRPAMPLQNPRPHPTNATVVLGELQRLRSGKLRLRFADEAINRFGAQSQVLSLSLPLTSRRVEGRALDTFIQGLLPEQQVRTMIENENGVPRNDDFALLRAIGAECAGAVQFLPPGTTATSGHLRDLSDSEVDDIVRGLPTLHAPDSLPLTASLGGVQAKVLLTKTDRGWAWPAAGAMSTHLIKPEPNTNVVVEWLIEAEHWASRVADTAGLRVAQTELQDFGGRLAIVVKRYDRGPDGRLHQEDFTQALGLVVLDKYERSAVRPGRLERIASEVSNLALRPTLFKETLLRMVTFNVLIGNSDAHSKNYSLLIDVNGNFENAPLYDVAPKLLLNRRLTTAGHTIGGQPDLRYVTRAHLLREAAAWGIKDGRAAALIDDVAASVARAAGVVAPIPELRHLPELIERRASQLRDGSTLQHMPADLAS
ncbi:type II toxin-antitoxin system HipA family toxin, partial [Cryobacterium sinapicolor]